MTSVGETLRSERVRRNLNLDQISRELKISSRLLEAIEAEQFEKLPGGVFTKSFVRQYARLLGLDDEELAGQVQRVLQPQAEAPELEEKPKPFISEFHVPKMEAWESVGETQFRWSGSLSAAAMVVVVMLICSGIYAWMQRPRTVATAHPAPPVQQPTPATQPVPPPTAPPVTPSETAVQPASPNPEVRPPAASASGLAAAPPKPLDGMAKAGIAGAARSDPNAPVRVEVTADEPVWVLARADGKYSFSGTLEAHQSRSVEANGKIELRLGNAGGVAISLNGKPIGAVGPKGQVRTVQFTSGGFQIVPAKPEALPDPL